MNLNELLAAIEPLQVVGNTQVDIHAIQFDSRKIESQDLFVAQVGTAMDGHSFISSVLEKGAAAIVLSDTAYMPKEAKDGQVFILVKNTDEALGRLASRWWGEPSKKMTLVGVTGTNGKTTIATLLYRLVQGMGKKAGLLSTVINYVDQEAIASTHTTPDALALNELLAKMVEAGCAYAFMEVSSHSIAQERIAGLDFDGALFTNLTRDHLDYHKTFDNYRDTKKRLFDHLKKDAFAISNKDDKNGLVMLQNCKALTKTYSTRSLADYRGEILEEGFEGMMLRINNHEVMTHLIGRFNLQNILCIYGAGVCLGFEPMDVLRVLSTLQPVNGRFETIHSPKGWTAVVDYAHTPDAVENVISTINDIRKKGKLITVVGCGGNRDKGKRPMMAQIASKGSDQLILTSDNPRDEEPQDILKDMAAGLKEEALRRTLIIEDRESAIKTACVLAQDGDVILVAGKGHENYQIIKGVKYHFDDHEVVRNNL